MNAIVTWKSKPPAERAKLALVPVLLVAFGGVLYWRFAGETVVAPPTVTGLAPAVTATIDRVTTLSAAGGQQVQAKKRVRVAWSDVAGHNPFRRPMEKEIEEPGKDAETATLTSVEPAIDDEGAAAAPAAEPPPRRWPAKVEAVFVDAFGAAAIVDGRVVHLGDQLESGARVVEISASAVTFEQP